MKQIPNALSIFRGIAAISLFFLRGRPVVFVTLYALCGISDFLDGYLARMFGTASTFGAMLDTIADIVFYILVATILLTKIHDMLWLICIVVIALVRFASMMVCKFRFSCWGGTHTVLNKIAGILVFLLPPLLMITNQTIAWFSVLAFFVAGISALEELAISTTTKSFDPDRKSILS